MDLVVMVMLLVLATVLQIGLPVYAFMGQARPPLLLAVVLYYALNRKGALSMVAALAAGLLHDALSEIPLGWSVLAFAAAGQLAGRSSDLITREHLVPHALIGAAASFGVTAVLYVALRLSGLLACSAGWALVKAGWTAGLGLVVLPVVCLAADRLDAFVGNIDVWEDVTGLE